MIALADVQAAAERLEGVARRTPVVRMGPHVWLKAENLQRTGAFKFRGAFNAIALLTDAHGVATVSSGNHAQAVALAARLHALPVTVLMPDDAPDSKREATQELGAEIIAFDRYGEDRDDLLRALVAERGLAPVHPYDDDAVMAGQGTVALELLAQVPEIETLVVPVGGGGLISGCATVAAAAGVRVVGVEPEAGDDTRRSLAAGRRVAIDVPRTIADGQQTPTPGELTFPVVLRHVAEIVTVSDEEIIAAMRFAHEELEHVLEPSGASALAAVMQGRVGGGVLGVVLTGGNVDAERYADLTRPLDW